jgi:Icc protein
VHQASDLSRNGVRFLTTPSTCFQFLPAADNFAVDTRPPGYRWLDLMADGTVATEVVWVDSE